MDMLPLLELLIISFVSQTTWFRNYGYRHKYFTESDKQVHLGEQCPPFLEVILQAFKQMASIPHPFLEMQKVLIYGKSGMSYQLWFLSEIINVLTSLLLK